MEFRCPACGAFLTDDSKFCNHCGTKIDDGVKRVEIKVDQHIENVAEIKRAAYEEKESLLRQKKIEQDLQKFRFKKIKWITIGVLALIGIILLGINALFIHAKSNVLTTIGALLLIIPISINIIVAMTKM